MNGHIHEYVKDYINAMELYDQFNFELITLASAIQVKDTIYRKLPLFVQLACFSGQVIWCLFIAV